MGLMQRQKGKRFERAIANVLRARFPDAVVRRASQADRAHQSDVYVSGGPALLSRLWLECQDARNPTPIAKLEQAERDIRAGNRDADADVRLPVAVWHKLGARDIHATMRIGTLDRIRGGTGGGHVALTMLLDDLLAIVEAVAVGDFA